MGLQKAEDKAGLAGPNKDPDPEDGDDADMAAPKTVGMDANDGEARQTCLLALGAVSIGCSISESQSKLAWLNNLAGQVMCSQLMVASIFRSQQV